MPVFDPPVDYLRQAIESVLGQLYGDWELCIADDASLNPEVKETIEKYASEATAVYFPYPRKLQGRPTGDTFMRKLVMTFDRDGLARAAIKSDAASHSFAAH